MDLTIGDIFKAFPPDLAVRSLQDGTLMAVLFTVLWQMWIRLRPSSRSTLACHLAAERLLEEKSARLSRLSKEKAALHSTKVALEMILSEISRYDLSTNNATVAANAGGSSTTTTSNTSSTTTRSNNNPNGPNNNDGFNPVPCHDSPPIPSGPFPFNR